ncbi:MAG TPA: hypothetical protein PLB55_01455 [Prosthecobacter sp.]|nr:hypothetical protein [Prosthecobacter sp.]
MIKASPCPDIHGMKKRAFIVIGIESSGNHLILSLLSKMTIGGVAVLGSDLADLEQTGDYRCHDFEAFNAAWLGEKSIAEIAQGRHFVTGRSYPCGGHYPDIAGFYNQCIQLNYDPVIVIIARDKSIIELSTKKAGHPEQNIEVKIARLVPVLTSQMRVRFISYEALFLWGEHYLDNWLAEEGPAFQIDKKWVLRIRNENKKYMNSQEAEIVQPAQPVRAVQSDVEPMKTNQAA